MKKLLFLTLPLFAGFIASCGEGSGGVYSALFEESPKVLEPAQAQCTITVSDSNGNGSIDNADIQTALNTARTNKQDDVVCIPAGTYNITGTLTYVLLDSLECGKKLTIRAEGGNVILNGGNSVKILYISTNPCSNNTDGDIAIEGITFQNGRSSDIGGGAGVYSRSGSITLINNTFSSNDVYGDAGGAYISSDSGSIILKNNIFIGNSAKSVGGAYVSSNSGSITLINNTFISNIINSPYGSCGGIAAFSRSASIILINNIFISNSAVNYSGVGGGACVYSFSGSITLTNNTFSGNSAKQGGGVYVNLYDNTAILHFYNNILWNNTANAGGNDGDDLYVNNDRNDDGIASPVNLAHNLFSTSTPSLDFSTAPQTGKVYILLDGNYNQSIASGCTNTGQYGNIQANPFFADADLRLQASSPAINAGCNNAPSIPSTDKDGNQRIWNGIVDMGAYEYGSQPALYTLTVNRLGNGSGTITSNPQGINCGSTCSANFDANSTVTLTATASSGSAFAGWEDDCSSCGNNATCQVIMTSAKTCIATFNLQQSGSGQTGRGGGGCSTGGTGDASMVWWLIPPSLALIRRLRGSA